MASGAEAERNRLRWRCRRGMRELDVLLERYLKYDWATADAAERRKFVELLEFADPDLAALCFGRDSTDDPALAALVGKLTDGRNARADLSAS